MIVWNKVTWYSKVLAVVLGIGIFILAFCLGQQYENVHMNLQSQRSGLNISTYSCGNGSEFSFIPSANQEIFHIVPASNVDVIPNVVVSSLPVGSRERYEGGGVSVFVLEQGRALRVTVGERPEVIECRRISVGY